MINKKLIPAALTTALLAGATAVQAETEFSANVALTSDYKFRGISQSDEGIAIQGGFDLSWDNGIYIGTWGSTVDFDTNGGGLDGSLELDYYIGWSSELGEDGNVSVDVGYLYYDYPGDNDFEGDYQEVYGSVSFYDITLGAAYSDDYYAETDKFTYLYVDYSLTLPEDFSLSFHVGHNDLEEKGGFLSDGQDSYIDYSVGISKEWASVEWSLAYVGTDLESEEVFDTDWGDDRVIFTVSKSM